MEYMESSYKDLNDILEGGEEDNTDKEQLKEELEEILKTLPYSLCVALIKISQINKYQPLELETYYQNILPTFHLLRRTDGSKYQTQSIKTVRSAMVSNKLFSKNENGLYELNIQNAFNYLKMIQKKKAIENGISNESNNLEEAIMMNNSKTLKKEKKDKKVKYDNISNTVNEFLGKKKKIKEKKYKSEANARGRVLKYEKAFDLLTNLLNISSSDDTLNSKLTFDLNDINDTSNLNDQNPNINKIIGMLTVFKFFKPFLEKSFSSIKVQEKIFEKIAEINAQVNCMDTIYRAQE